ncbi:hypothetical protein GHT06_009488 [Daphnia sinensis]|uniref:Uncharacterized protein n=1 Tax=Daphnia sinensis TaxID=1820382 RepID=A0AAD5Q3R0_9CRUS|nr:hypothetical protein GHT06_009488 [Daphnia sinensis]
MERVLSRRRLEKCEIFVKEREMTRSHCSCKHDCEFIRFGLILHLEQRQLNIAITFDGLKQRYGS